ncbi:NFX1-type zinc finger-containing protein 1 [Striga asiatica]|uniref:NFX1-type zinc finger-containing protein 1 n=1 Tax=Striga asiatica TaxID=4170 RepID=A0A5A7PWK0_STRAF|nr:NFX1-type zinc finger-containing protein 1 [Striga asiatica]
MVVVGMVKVVVGIYKYEVGEEILPNVAETCRYKKVAAMDMVVEGTCKHMVVVVEMGMAEVATYKYKVEEEIFLEVAVMEMMVMVEVATYKYKVEAEIFLEVAETYRHKEVAVMEMVVEGTC